MIGKTTNLNTQSPKSKIAYILSQFPETHETFILREIKALEKRGIKIEILSLKPCKDRLIHPEAKELMERTIYGKTLSLWSIAYSLSHPLKTFSALCYIIKSYITNPKELIKALYVFLECLYFIRIVTKREISHIHSHWATMPTTAAMVLSKLTGFPFSLTAHAWDIFINSNGLAEKIKSARFVVTCTDYNRNYLEGLCKDEESRKIYRNYHGIDLNKFKNGQQTTNNRKLKILSIGRLVETKGFKYLIEACSILAKRRIDLDCQIVGEGPLEKSLKLQATSYKLQEKIKFLGIRPQEEIKAMYSEATVLVQSSVIAKNGDRDGIPNVILEAMAMGLPAISTNFSGIPEAVINQETGILVPPKNSTALADAIENLQFNSSLRTQLAKEGRKLVEEKFNIKRNTEELINIFRQNGALNDL